MANSEYNYIPTYIRRTINNRPKDVVTAKYWNELFNLLITQGDHTAEELGNILNYFSTRLVDAESEIAESAEAIANIREVFRINVTYSGGVGGVYSADKTFAEIKDAYDAGQLPYVVYGGDTIYTLSLCSFESTQMFMDFERCLVGDGILEAETLRIYSYITDSGSNVVKRIDEFKMPTSLKNPNALTFTGGATGSYDGSEPKTVDIPVIPYEVINKNTAARHTHINKSVLDSITADDVAKWDETNCTTYIKVDSTDDVISTVNGETYADIQALINDGKPVVVRFDNDLDFYYFETFRFSDSSGTHKRLNFRCVMGSIVYTLTLRDDNTWVFRETSLQPSSITDTGGYFTTDTVEGALQEIGAGLALKADKSEIPTALPNPHKLTINGTEYDGSVDVQMTIQGGGGTSDHSQLTNRDAANQHPITAITGLQTALDSKADAADIPSLEGYATEAYVQNYHDNTKQDKITSTNKLAYSLISGTPTIPTVPTNLSAFTNDAGYLTLATLPKYEGVVE